MNKFWVEVLVVGLANAVVGSAISLLIMYADKDFNIQEYHFWWQVALAFFITGVLLHMGFEYAGLNTYYCKHGWACS